MKLVDPTGMYGINPNPYNPKGTNPCDTAGPLCIQWKPDQSVSQEDVDKTKKRTEDLKNTIPSKVRTYLTKVLHVTPEELEEALTDGKGPVFDLLREGGLGPSAQWGHVKNRGYVNLERDKPGSNLEIVLMHELVHHFQEKKGATGKAELKALDSGLYQTAKQDARSRGYGTWPAAREIVAIAIIDLLLSGR